MNVLNDRFPKLDLHGEDRIGAKVKVESFIKEQFIIGNYEFMIIHGIGQGILKKEVHEVLRKNKLVEEFKLDNFNAGSTYVRISSKSWQNAQIGL